MDDVCRLCSSEVELMNVFNIDTGRLVNMIKVASGVEILQTDKISQKVCRQCCKLSAEVFRFRQRSAKNSQDLMEKYNKSIQSESPKIISNKEIHVDWNNIKITKNINVDSPNKSTKVHPSILQMKQQYPNIKFPPLQPDAHYQPYITLLTNEVSDWYQQRNSRTDALYQVDEESLEQPQSPSSSNDDSYSSSSELETVFSRDIEDQNEREETLLQKDQKQISQNITKNHSFSNIQDYEMETNQIECQSNSIQNDPKQTSNVMDGIKRKRSVSQPTDEESIKETPRSKSSKIEIINNEIIREKYVTTVNQNIKSNPQVENSSPMTEKITNTSNSDKKKSSGVEEMNDVIETKKPNENRSPSKLKTSKKDEIQNKKAELELNYNRDKEIIVSIKTREDISQLIEEENCKKTSKIKDSEKLVENNEVNGKYTEFNENTKIDQLEEKGANTSNKDKQGSSGIDEASKLMETRKRKEGRSSCKVKKSKLEIENQNINVPKEMEVKNQAGQQEKSSVNNVDEKKSTEEENLQEAHTNKNSMKEVINEKGDGKFVEKLKSKPVENKNQIEEKEATKLKSVQNGKEIQNRNVSLANVEAMKFNERQNEVLFKPTDKQPAINFCVLRNVLREKLKANSTNNETNNVESNDVTTSSSILPNNTNISPPDNPNIAPPDNPNISPPNNTLKMSFIRSLNLIPFSERGAYEKDTSHEMLRVRCIKYACEYCQTNYNTLRSLKVHEKKYHTSCVFCNLHLDSVENRKKHMLFYCPKRTIKVPKVVLVRVDKQKEMIAKYAQAFQLLNSDATSSAQQTNNSINVDSSDSESTDYVNLRPLKLNWNVNNYNDVINAMNANDPNLLENIYNKIKDRTSFTLDNIVKSPTDNEYYLKNLAPELYFQKVKIILKCGKEIAFHYNEDKNLPATSPKNFWVNETPIQPQVIQKTHQTEIHQTTVSPTNINHNFKTDKNANLQGNVGKVIDNVKNKVRKESNMTTKVTQNATSQNTLQSPNVKLKVVGCKNPALPSPNSSKMNEILPPRMTGTEIQKTITQNIVALNNLNDKSVQNRLVVRKEMEKLNTEKRRQFHKVNVTSSTNTATTSQAINVQNGVPSTVNNATSTPKIGMTLKRVNTKSGLVYEMVNCGINQNMGTGEAKEQLNVANRTVTRKVPEGGNSEKTAVKPGVTTNKVINEKVNTIQHSSVSKRAPSQLTTMKNNEQSIEDKKLIQQLEAEIAKMGRKNLSVELPSKVTNVSVQGQTSLQPIHLPGTSNQSQNLPSGYLIYSFPSTSRTNASKSTTCSTNAVPKISQDVPTTSTHVQEITTSQATNLPGTSTQTSGNVSQKPLPTPLLYSLPTGNKATAPVGALYHLLAGHNLIFLPQQQITPASSQVQTTSNNRSILLNKQTNLTLSPSVQMPSPATVTSQVQLSPTTAVVSNSDATNTNVSKIRVKDIKELS